MKYVALLRGINVGGNNKVEMKKLRQSFEDMGFLNVVTYINSGNVIFDSKMKPKIPYIERTLSDELGFNIKIVIRDKNNIKHLVQNIPESWQNNTEQKTDVLFLWDDFDRESTMDLIIQTPGIDTLTYINGAIVWHINKQDYTKSGMNKFIGTQVYKNMTARNINTVRKLLGVMEK